MLKREIVFPKRVMLVQGNIKNAEQLLIPAPLQSTLGNYTRPFLQVKGKGCIVLDFGMEMRGGLRIITRALASPNAIHKNKNALPTMPVRIRFGESVSECCAELGEKNATNDHSPRDITCELVAMSDLTLVRPASALRASILPIRRPICPSSPSSPTA